MRRHGGLLALAATIALSSSQTLPALAGAVDDSFAVAAGAPFVSDEEMAQIHGRYIVAPALGGATAAAVNGPLALRATNPSAGPVSQTAGPHLDVHGPSGSVVYFGIVMHSEWQSGTGPNATTYSVGAGVGADLQTQHVSVTTWSVKNGTNGGDTGRPRNTIDGGIASGTVSGVAQTIQISGNGNTAANHAAVDVGPGGFVPVLVPTGAPCGSACSVNVGANGVGVSISTPAGSAMQGINAGSVSQNVKVLTDFNQVANTLQLQVQTGNSSFSPASLLSTILQAQVLHR